MKRGASTTGRNSTADRAIDVLFLFDVAHTGPARPATSPSASGCRAARPIGTCRACGRRTSSRRTRCAGGFRLGSRVFELARIARVRASVCRRSRCRSCAYPRPGGRRDRAAARGAPGTWPCASSGWRSPAHPAELRAGPPPSAPCRARPRRCCSRTKRTRISSVDSLAPFERFTDTTITDPDDLRRELASIRERGYALSNGERDVGVRGVAAPMFGPDGRVTAGISVGCLAFELTETICPRSSRRCRPRQSG